MGRSRRRQVLGLNPRDRGTRTVHNWDLPGRRTRDKPWEVPAAPAELQAGRGGGSCTLRGLRGGMGRGGSAAPGEL